MEFHVLVIVAIIASVHGHGRLMEPPSRASAWRFGFKTPANYNDNELFCGGFGHQQKLGMKCGICGDAWDGPRRHEAGGKYATGTIVRNYKAGETFDLHVELTASHKGYFEFRLCPNNDVTKAATQACLDQNVLVLSNGKTRYPITSYGSQWIRIQGKLPDGLTCSQCVLQWKYNTGNSWGVDKVTGKGCVGCGDQEQFYGCADISIGGSGTGGVQTKPTEKPKPETPRPTRPPIRPTKPKPTTAKPVVVDGDCKATGAWTGNAQMDAWCKLNCAAGNCPATHCRCL